MSAIEAARGAGVHTIGAITEPLTEDEKRAAAPLPGGPDRLATAPDPAS